MPLKKLWKIYAKFFIINVLTKEATIVKPKMNSFYIYLIACLACEVLSFVSLFFHLWEIPAILAISIVFAIIYYLLLIKGVKFIRPDNQSGVGLFYLFVLLRYLCAILGLLLPALLLYFTRGDTSKWRYLYLIIATLPFLGVTISMVFEKNHNLGGENGNQ